MVAQNTSTVNSQNVNDAKESALTSYIVTTSAHGRPDVSLRPAGETQMCVVHRADDLQLLADANLDLAEGKHVAPSGVVIAYREQDGRLIFLGVRGSLPKKPAPVSKPRGDQRVGKLKAFRRGDWCGTATLALKIEGEARSAEAAGAVELGKIRALGLPFDAARRGEWVDAPAGYRVRYAAAKTGPSLDFIALERETATEPTSTPTDGSSGAVVLLPAWADSVSDRLFTWYYLQQPYRLPAGKPIALPAPRRSLPKNRRYQRRQPQQVVGETTYKFSSELLVQLPRPERHALMNGLDRLISHEILPYLHGSKDSSLDVLREAMRRFEGQLVVIKGKTTQARNAAAPSNPIAAANAELARQREQQIARRFEGEAAELRQLLKGWLDLDLKPVGNSADMMDGEVKISYVLEGFTSARSLRVILYSPALIRPISRSIYKQSEAKDTIEALWKAYEKRIEQIALQAGRRDGQKDKRIKSFPLHPQYLQ